MTNVIKRRRWDMMGQRYDEKFHFILIEGAIEGHKPPGRLRSSLI